MASAAGLGNIIGAATQGTTGFLTTLEGKLELQKAKKREQAAGARPTYETPNPILENQVLAESNFAQGGLSEAARQILTDQNQQAFASALSTLMRTGGGLNSMSELYGVLGQNTERLALLDDEINFRNLQLLMNQNKSMGEEMDKLYQINKLAPWADEKQAIAEMRALAHNKVSAGRTMINQSGATISGSDSSGMGGSGQGSKSSMSKGSGGYQGEDVFGQSYKQDIGFNGYQKNQYDDNYILKTYYGK